MAKPWNIRHIAIVFDEREHKWVLSIVPQVGDVLVLLCASYENALKMLIEVLLGYLAKELGYQVKEEEENAKNL